MVGYGFIRDMPVRAKFGALKACTRYGIQISGLQLDMVYAILGLIINLLGLVGGRIELNGLKKGPVSQIDKTFDCYSKIPGLSPGRAFPSIYLSLHTIRRKV